MKRKIMLISEVCLYGTYEHLSLLLKILLKENFKIYFLYGKKRMDKRMLEFLVKNPEIHSIEIETFESKVSFKDLCTFIKIRKLIKEIKPDIVHCHSSIAGFSGRIAAKSCGVKKIIYSPHGYYFLNDSNSKIKSKIFLIAEKILSFFTDYTVTTSQSEEECYQKNQIGSKDKSILIENGINEKKLNEQEVLKIKEKINYQKEDFIIGWMGRFSEQKDPKTMIEIFEILGKKGIKSIIFSDRFDYEIKSENVFYMGKTDYPDEALSVMNIYLSTSLYEELPYAMIKALSLRKPIVATEVIGNIDCVKNGENGYLFEVRNVSDAVSKILKIKDDNKSQIIMKNKSYEIFKKKFSLDSMRKKYMKLYEE